MVKYINCIINTVVDCGSAPMVGPHVVADGSDTTFNSTVTYSCELGHQLTLGAIDVNLCTASGNWSQPNAPDCEGQLSNYRVFFTDLA